MVAGRLEDCPGYPEELIVEINLCETLRKLLNTLFLTNGETNTFFYILSVFQIHAEVVTRVTGSLRAEGLPRYPRMLVC